MSDEETLREFYLAIHELWDSLDGIHRVLQGSKSRFAADKRLRLAMERLNKVDDALHKIIKVPYYCA